MSEAIDPCELLEQYRSRHQSNVNRAFSCACCRRIWGHLSASLQRGLEVAEQYLAGSVDDDIRKAAANAIRNDCIYVDGDSLATDRLNGFAAEAVLNCLFGENDYPPIPTYATTCAIATSRATIEVLYANAELMGHDENSCMGMVSQELDWQCKLISKLFDISG